jgi:8-oxo-dGTP diphosphatase
MAQPLKIEFFILRYNRFELPIINTMTQHILNQWFRFLDYIEYLIRIILVKITNRLSVKIIRDDQGIPFLYRYHLFALTSDGPGMCIHRFVKSDPDRGYHDHPWSHSLSFILAGGYEERIFDGKAPNNYNTHHRGRWSFNHLDGNKTFHRVMIEEGKDSWSLFWFLRRSKKWGMIGLDNKYKRMSETIKDGDGGWWKWARNGFSVNNHVPLKGSVISTVDIVLCTKNNEILLIKRGKEPFKDHWAFPGGRVEHTDEDLLSAALRELKEETNICDVKLDQAYTVGNNKRDPRGFCITTVFANTNLPDKLPIKAGDDAVNAKWFSIRNLPDEIAFDHAEIMYKLGLF